MIAVIDEHRGAHGAAPLRGVLRIAPSTHIAPSTYHEHAARRADPSRSPPRAGRDAEPRTEVRRVFAENLRVYGVRKVWHQLRREGVPAARCTVARPMRGMGLSGVIRGKPVRATMSDKAAPCPLDRVHRQFRTPGPNMPWVADFTHVATRSGFAYVAFVIDAYPRRIVGWRVGRSAHAGFVPDALEQAPCERQARRPLRTGGHVTCP